MTAERERQRKFRERRNARAEIGQDWLDTKLRQLSEEGGSEAVDAFLEERPELYDQSTADARTMRRRRRGLEASGAAASSGESSGSSGSAARRASESLRSAIDDVMASPQGVELMKRLRKARGAG